MKKTTLSIALFMTIGLITNAQNAINLTKGQKTHLVNKSISTVKQNVMGQEMEIKSDITIDIDVEIKEKKADLTSKGTTVVMGQNIPFTVTRSTFSSNK